MGRIVGQVQRVDDAHARKGQALLARQVGNGLGQSMAQRMAAALQHSGIDQARHRIGRDRAVGHAAFGRLDFHQCLQPQQAARAVAHDLHLKAARRALALQGAGHGVSAHGQRGGIAGHVDAHAGACPCSCMRRLGHRLAGLLRLAALRDECIQSIGRDMRMGLAIEHHGRR